MNKKIIGLISLSLTTISIIGIVFYKRKNKDKRDFIELENNKYSQKKNEEDSKLVYNEYFNCNIKKEYEEHINVFINNENASSLQTMSSLIFENGDFNYDSLKEMLTKKYSNIKNITTSEIFALPSLNIFPLERYLSEIDTLKESDAENKVEGILSYWLTIAETLYEDYC